MRAAAFRRLCVETAKPVKISNRDAQPPSGGCVLKRDVLGQPSIGEVQPPSGGCVLKLNSSQNSLSYCSQPPSGGCVLKRLHGFLQF